MSFKTWFKQWRRSLYRLFMIGTKPYKSDSQRKKEHERYIKAKSSRKGRYRVIEKKKRRRHSGNYKTLSALMGFMASSLSIVHLPFGLLHWGYKSTQKSRGARKTTPNSASRTASKPQQGRPGQRKAADHNAHASGAPEAVVRNSSTEAKREPSATKPFMTYEKVWSDAASVTPERADLEPDKNDPKSKPKNEEDQYIRKRMIIAGSSYCNRDVLSRLEIGSYLEVVAEPDNPYDKDAVMLLYNGEKVGYISKKDKLPFVTCLKLGRKVYGVITDIKGDEFPQKYEFETWFDRE